MSRAWEGRLTAPNELLRQRVRALDAHVDPGPGASPTFVELGIWWARTGQLHAALVVDLGTGRGSACHAYHEAARQFALAGDRQRAAACTALAQYHAHRSEVEAQWAAEKAEHLKGPA